LGEKVNGCRVWVAKPEKRGHFEYLDVEWGMILKWIKKN
jgi:hypothetical protein